MKRLLTLFVVAHAMISMTRVSDAALYTIGTATYAGNAHNLIYEGQLGGSGLVWLDYRSPRNTWQNQVNWAAELSLSQTQITLDARYRTAINWSTGWRLPTTNESEINLYAPWSTDKGDGTGFGWGGPDGSGYYDYYFGYNMLNSEMGHLYYVSLRNIGYISEDETWEPSGWGLGNIDAFFSLRPNVCWSNTEYSRNESDSWRFSFQTGDLNRTDKETYYNALAVHPGSVSASGVPVPGAVWLLGSSVVGLIGIRRRLKSD